MKHIHDSISLCNECYRHIPAIVYEDEDKIWITKKCHDHGEQKELVEIDPDFYYGIKKQNPGHIRALMFETTNKCQLNCPHCYQLPDNAYIDDPLQKLIDQVDSYPKGFMPMLAGAECTLYNDIIPLSHYLAEHYYQTRLLTNGIRFADMKFTKALMEGHRVSAAIGLNHWTYQGKKVHEKQLRGIQNIKDVAGSVDDIAYTIEDLDHIPEILEEVDKLKDGVKLVRLRLGSFIGRSSDKHRNFLSKTLNKIKSIVGDELQSAPVDDNPYHVMYTWRGVTLRIIQWPDVRNIDMEELNTGPWANFQDGPLTNFVHQVILRDAFVNNSKPRLDWAPSYYHIKTPDEIGTSHWKTNWQGPVEFTEFEYKIDDPTKRPLSIDTWKN